MVAVEGLRLKIEGWRRERWNVEVLERLNV
jgi:hypothetical protein